MNEPAQQALHGNLQGVLGEHSSVSSPVAKMDILRLIWLLVCLVSNLNVEETFGVHVSFIDQGRSSVPDEMNPNITVLDIWSNEISVIKQTDFNDKYPALNIVNLDKNQIVYIENGCFRGTSLNSIYLSSNQLTAIPDFHEVSTTLTNLGLKDNKITEITANKISYLTKLERLYLSSNPIVSLADMHKNLPSLFRLGVEGIPFQCCCSVAWLKRISDLLIDTNPCTHPWKWNSFSLDQITEEMLQEQPCGTSSAQLYLCGEMNSLILVQAYKYTRIHTHDMHVVDLGKFLISSAMPTVRQKQVASESQY